MSTPRNHHYVSKIHIKQFYNRIEKKIYLYDKIRHNHYTKLTTKTVFSELDSNTKYINGDKDFKSLEDELNEHFEKDFKKNVEIISEFIENKKRTKLVDKALFYFTKYGIIGDLRTPRHKKHLDDSMWNAMQDIIPISVPKLKQEIEEMFAYRDEVKYSNLIGYVEIANKIIDKMGGLAFAINIPENDEDYFVLPDCSGITVRAKINEYFNPDIKEIAYVGLPLSSKIYMHFFSEKLFDQRPDSKIVAIDSNEVKRLNLESLNISQGKIACENQEYLKNLIP